MRKKTSKSQQGKSGMKKEHFLVEIDRYAGHVYKILAVVEFQPELLLFEPSKI